MDSLVAVLLVVFLGLLAYLVFFIRRRRREQAAKNCFESGQESSTLPYLSAQQMFVASSPSDFGHHPQPSQKQSFLHFGNSRDNSVTGLELSESILQSVKNRRESLPSSSYSRRTSFDRVLDEVSGEFVRNVKLKRALSTDSMVSSSSDIGDQDMRDFENGNGDNSSLSPSSSSSSCSTPQLFVSMSYLPTAERLSLVTVRLRLPSSFTNNNKSTASADDDTTGQSSCASQPHLRMVCVKACLINGKTGKRSAKKKTSLKAVSDSGSASTSGARAGHQAASQSSKSSSVVDVSFNELMIFKLPIQELHETAVRLSATGFGSSGQQQQSSSSSGSSSSRLASASSVHLGSIVIGPNAPTQPGRSHFATMMTSMRRPVSQWHAFQTSTTPHHVTSTDATVTSQAATNGEDDGQSSIKSKVTSSVLGIFEQNAQRLRDHHDDLLAAED